MSKTNTAVLIPEIQELAKTHNIEESSALQLTSGLELFKQEREKLKLVYNEIISKEITPELVKEFTKLRIAIKKNRTSGIEAWHKQTKEYFLHGGRFVDAIKNKEVVENQYMEDKLSEGEKYYENLEIERKAKLKEEREKSLEPFGTSTKFIKVDEMSDEEFSAFYKNEELSFIAREEAKKAEAKRLEEERIEKERLVEIAEYRKSKISPLWAYMDEEQRSIDLSSISNEEFEVLYDCVDDARIKHEEEIENRRKEAEKLKARSTELAPYSAFIADYNEALSLDDESYSKLLNTAKSVKSANDALLKIEAEKIEAERIKAEEARIKAEEQAKKNAEDLAVAKAELLKKQKEEEEELTKKKEEKELELRKGDADKIKDLLSDLNSLKSKYSFDSQSFKDMYNNVNIMIDRTVKGVQEWSKNNQ